MVSDCITLGRLQMINRRDFCKGFFGAGAVLGFPFGELTPSTAGSEDVSEVLRSIADVLNDPSEVLAFQKPDLMKIMTRQTGRLVVGTGFGSGMEAAGLPDVMHVIVYYSTSGI
jgi:hypothetical protein